ncbi:MAG TPA: ComEC/Rec2 family competence protein, partial [bacterium]|nr:ComEC/Rec2 family competence protein [bacterium]
MNFKKLMAFCWIYILGIIIASAYVLSSKTVILFYSLAGISLLIGGVLWYIQRDNLSISDNLVMTFMLIGAFFLGYARYTHSYNFADPHHISAFGEEEFNNKAPTYQIIGKITAEPDVFHDKTQLTITPYLIKQVGGKERYKKVAGGDLMLQIKRKDFRGNINPLWAAFSVPEVYGDMVRIQGQIMLPRQASDPFGYDHRKFMNSNGVYAIIYNPKRITKLDQNEEMDKQEKEIYESKRNKSYNPLYLLTKLALKIKRSMLMTIKQTMPYPESAFLGGITLGLKRGLDGMPTILNEYYDKFKQSVEQDNPTILEEFLKNYDPDEDKNSQLIRDQFQWSGVGHVLAVSGLHVTIITIFLFGIFTALRIHRKVFAPLLIFALVIFCIITGAAPSSTRATLMNSIGVLTMVYSKRGSRAAALFSIGAAGFLILLNNPLIIYAPSFMLSFGAVLALVLVTKPVDIQLMKLRGLPFIFAIFLLLGFFVMVKYAWFLLVNPIFYIPAIIIIILVFKLLYRLDEQYPLIGDVGYHSIPNVIRQFLSAQFAIQLGMMIPMSAWFFGKFPVVGMLANFIAIPLVGINVQLGMLAGIFGLIPGIGLWLALVINATNWILCKFFLWSAHFFCQLLPYPHITNWTLSRTLLYSAVLAIFIWWDAFNRKKEELYYRMKLPIYGAAGEKIKKIEKVAALIILLILIVLTMHPKPDGARVTVLDVGLANANVIQLANGKTFLINGALAQRDAVNPFVKFDQGDRVVFNYLKRQGIIAIDAVILQSFNDEYLTGLQSIVEGAIIKEWYDIVDHTKVNSKTSIENFFDALGDSYLKQNIDKPYVQKIYKNYMKILKVLEAKKVKLNKITRGDIIALGKVKGVECKLICLNPPSNYEETGLSLEDKSAVLKFSYGSKSIVFGGNILENGLEDLSEIDKAALKTDALVAPGNGMPQLLSWRTLKDSELGEKIKEFNTKVLELFEPDYVIASYSRPRTAGLPRNITSKYRVMANGLTVYENYAKEKGTRFFRTDNDRAV